MLFFNPDQAGPDSQHQDAVIDEVLAQFKDAVTSGDHTYVTLEWMQLATGPASTPVKDEAAGPGTADFRTIPGAVT